MTSHVSHLARSSQAILAYMHAHAHARSLHTRARIRTRAHTHRYVELDEELPYTLMDQKEAGKKVLYCVISLHVRGEGESAKESGGGKKSAGSRRGPYTKAFTRLSGRGKPAAPLIATFVGPSASNQSVKLGAASAERPASLPAQAVELRSDVCFQNETMHLFI